MKQSIFKYAPTDMVTNNIRPFIDEYFEEEKNLLILKIKDKLIGVSISIKCF